MKYDDFGAPLPDGWLARGLSSAKKEIATWPASKRARFAAESEFAINVRRQEEYAHLPQIAPSDDFFLLPPASKTAQEIGTNVARNEFHSGAEITGKPIAVANGFAKTKQEKSCGNVTGKGCSGKPSLFEEERAAKSCDCQELKLLAENIAKLAEIAADLLYWRKEGSRPSNEIRRIAQDLRQLACQK